MEKQMIKEKPILFSSSMVNAILSDKKTMTRRVVKPQPDHFHDFGNGWIPQHGDKDIKWPYEKGLRLWVRETWMDTGTPPGNIHYKASATDNDLTWLKEQGHKWRPSIHMPRWASRITLEVTDVRVERLQDISEEDAYREGCRAVRWYQPWKKTEGESINLHQDSEYMKSQGWWTDKTEISYRNYFANLWDSINAARGYGWEANPWVWVIEFRVVST